MKKRKKPTKRNPIAATLPLFAQRKVAAKKGKGSFTRKVKHKETE